MHRSFIQLYYPASQADLAAMVMPSSAPSIAQVHPTSWKQP